MSKWNSRKTGKPENRKTVDSRQNEQPGRNIQYPVPLCGIPQGGRMSNVQVNSRKTGKPENRKTGKQ